MKLIHVPIERLPNRYTADWVDQFESVFKTTNIDFVTVEGNESNQVINSGSVLDCFGTNRYKLQQLDKIIEMLQKGEIIEDDVIFFADLWFPGLESLFYVRNISGIDFKIAGIFHAGTWDPYDFTSRTGMRKWGQHVETSWLHGIDMIFVATQWHKDLIVMNSAEFDENKIFVTGIPFYANELKTKYPISKKEDIIVFPHRMDEEKHPEKFDRLAKKFPKWTFIKTIEKTTSRDEYFKLLARSKVMVSYAEQETFGYSTVESMALGNYVIVPDELSYRETVPKDYRYAKEREIPDMLENFMSLNELPVYPELAKWSTSIEKMLRVIGVKIRQAAKFRKEQEEFVRLEQKRIEEERKARIERNKAEKLAKEQEKIDNLKDELEKENNGA